LPCAHRVLAIGFRGYRQPVSAGRSGIGGLASAAWYRRPGIGGLEIILTSKSPVWNNPSSRIGDFSSKGSSG
jgi:hypothetical protein